MILFNKVSMTYPGGKEALHNINLHIERGAMAYVTGRSGAGKSTLLRLIALIDRHTRGQLIINGQNLERVRGRVYRYSDATLASYFRIIACCSTAVFSTMSPCRWSLPAIAIPI